MAKKTKETVFEGIKAGLEEAIAYSRGKKTGAVIHRIAVPEHIDVKAIRRKLDMTADVFSKTFGFPPDNVRSWECGRREPSKSARILLTLIARNPTLVLKAARE